MGIKIKQFTRYSSGCPEGSDPQRLPRKGHQAEAVSRCSSHVSFSGRTGIRPKSRGNGRKGETRRAWRSSVCPNRAHLHQTSSSKNTAFVMAYPRPSPWNPRCWFPLALSTKPSFQPPQALSTEESSLSPLPSPTPPRTVRHKSSQLGGLLSGD